MFFMLMFCTVCIKPRFLGYVLQFRVLNACNAYGMEEKKSRGGQENVTGITGSRRINYTISENSATYIQSN